MFFLLCFWHCVELYDCVHREWGDSTGLEVDCKALFLLKLFLPPISGPTFSPIRYWRVECYPLDSIFGVCAHRTLLCSQGIDHPHECIVRKYALPQVWLLHLDSCFLLACKCLFLVHPHQPKSSVDPAVRLHWGRLWKEAPFLLRVFSLPPVHCVLLLFVCRHFV